MKRLIEKTVFCGLVTAWRLATVPTRLSPPCVKATTDGVVRPPSAFSMTVGSPPSSTAMHELVVPRSMPMVLPMWECSFKWLYKSKWQSGRFPAGLQGAHGCQPEPAQGGEPPDLRRGVKSVQSRVTSPPPGSSPMYVTRIERNVNIAAVVTP